MTIVISFRNARTSPRTHTHTPIISVCVTTGSYYICIYALESVRTAANSGISPKGFQIAAWPKRSRKWHTVLKIMGEITEFRVLDDRPRDWFHGAHSQDPSYVRIRQARQKSDFSYLVRRTTGSNVAGASGNASHHQSRSISHHVL